MQDFLDKVFLSNSIRSYALVISIVLVVFILKRILTKFIASRLYKMVSKSDAIVKRQSFLNKVVKPLDVFLVLMVAVIAFDELKFPELLNFKILKVSFKEIISSISNGALVIVFIWLCRRIIDFIALILEEKANKTPDQTDNQLIVFFKDFFKVVFVIIGVLLILRFSFHKNISNLLTGLSIVGAAIALSLRESLENLIASFIIFFNKPFITGDLVKVNNFTGTVEKIGLRSTRLRTDVKTFVTVPNKQMVDSILDNLTMRTQRKIEVRLEISLDTTVQQLKQLTPFFQEMIKNYAAIESNHIYFMETGKNAHVFAVDLYTSITQTIQEFNAFKEEINLRILEILAEQKIELAAKSSTVTVHRN